jgi:hypothetical protein
MRMSLHPYVKVRECIEQVENYEVKNFLKTVYLLAVARPVELLAKPVSGQTRVYGVKGVDVRVEKIDKPPLSLSQTMNLLSQLENNEIKIREVKGSLSKKIEIAVFSIPLSRQSNKTDKKLCREVAIPIQPDLEPWTQDLLRWFKKAGDDFVFTEHRSHYWNYVKYNQVFKDLTAVIGGYRRIEHTISRKKSTKVEPHEKEMNLGGLYKVREDELQKEYGFDEYDCAVYTGAQIRIANKRIVQMDWHRYINKLCQKSSPFEVRKQLMDFP